MNESLKLLPCPFCGGETILDECPNCGELNIVANHADDCWMLEYQGCYDIPASEREQYIAAWNARAQTVFGMTLDEVRQMMKRDAERERTCKFVDDSDSETSPPKCNVCGYDPGIYECAWYEDGTYGYERNYCPNCGAKVVR